MKVFLLSIIAPMAFSFPVATRVNIANSQIDGMLVENGGVEKWLPETYVRDVDFIYRSTLKGIKAMLYLCGDEGLTKRKAEAVNSMLKQLLDSFKPLQQSDLPGFSRKIEMEIRQSIGVRQNRNIIPQEIYHREVDKLDILGVECDDRRCLEYYNDEPYTIWYLFHSLSVAKSHQMKEYNNRHSSVKPKFTPYNTMNVIMEVTDQCIFDGNSQDNPFSQCKFGRCSWIKESNNYENEHENEVKDTSMGLVMWLWRVHNALCVEESLAQTAAAKYSGFKASQPIHAANHLGQDVRFPPIKACKNCRVNISDSSDRATISRHKLSCYINGKIDISDLDYIADFSIKETYDFLLHYYGDGRWYTNNYKIRWDQDENHFCYYKNVQADVKRDLHSQSDMAFIQ